MLNSSPFKGISANFELYVPPPSRGRLGGGWGASIAAKVNVTK